MKGLRVPKELPPWRDVVASAERESWYPLCFDRKNPHHVAAMDELMGTGDVVHVHDTIDAQLADLVKCRHPSKNFTAEELSEKVSAHLAGASAHDHGRWAYFPWSRRLVHLLPPDEFAEVRSDRNRNKITRAEQLKLGHLKIALAGLSVGNAIANTLALEGVFGELRMADFDTLDLSNMNRIRCAVHHIGINKAIIGARQIFEQNPYANLVLFTDGVTPENLEEFLNGADMCLDECDSLYIKIKLREEARARKIPVVMETSDRGMLDIERFDLEPDRPILHGLLGDLTAEKITQLPPAARLPLILNILGMDTISPRLAASMLELGRSVRGISQLGSDVTLGGATTTAVVRRFGLGLPLQSGRMFTDMSSMLAEIQSPTLPMGETPELKLRREITRIRTLVEAAVQAPSEGNLQPWRFQYLTDEQVLRVCHDHARSGGAGHELGRQMALIAIGAAIENISIAATAQQQTIDVKLFPSVREPHVVAELRLTPRTDAPTKDPLSEQIGQRLTNRRSGARANLTPVHGQVLTSAARDSGARLQLCTGREGIESLAQILGAAERIRLLSPTLQAELLQSMRWSDQETEQTRDGIHIDTYSLDELEGATLRLIRQPQVTKILRDVDGGSSMTSSITQAVTASAAIGLLTVTGTTPESFVRGGRAMQQVWLTATALGLSTHPINGFVSMLARVERYQGFGLSKHEIRTLFDLREPFNRCFTGSMSNSEILLFRLSYADPPAKRTLRRSIDDVFVVGERTSAPL